MKFIPLLGRFLFTLPFLISVPMHFQAMGVNAAVAEGVPMASFLVPFSGVMALVGGLSVLLGYKAKFGAWILIAFLIPVNFMMHKFWNMTDPAQQQQQMMTMVFFIKDLSMTGAAFLIAYFGAGPLSFDAMAMKKSE